MRALGPGAERFVPGDRVMAIVGGGGQAELAVVHERTLLPVPDELDWPAAGSFPEVFTTAHDALFTQGELRPGERLLVHGGAGGVGTAAIQLARASGARATATVRDAALRNNACQRVADWLAAQPSWRVSGVIESPIAGADGNVEFLIAGQRG